MKNRIERNVKWVVLLGLLVMGFVACTKNQSGVSVSSQGDRSTKVTIQKNEGINVNESDAIWITGMKVYSGSTRVVKVHRMELKSELNYPVTTSDLVLRDGKGRSGSGIRTYVMEDGLLMAKSGGGEVGLYLARKGKGGNAETIWEMDGFAAAGRATPMAYRLTRGNVHYDYVGVAVKEVSNSFYRIYRFRKEGNGFVALRALRIEHPNSYERIGVYTGFLDTCSTKISGECAPRFWGGWRRDFFGVNLAVDIPGTLDDGKMIAVPHIDPPNKNFVSNSHPAGGQVGTINGSIYSMSGDDEGNQLLAHFPDTGQSNNFTSYDKVNQLVFLATRATELEPDTSRANQRRSALYVFKKECFSTNPDCDPSAQAPAPVNARIFRDVGLDLGPTSDLGNGCVAVLSFKRPGEPGGNSFFTKVYRACIRDPKDLDKGLTVSLLGEVEGAAYMYNDFTGATLFDRPIYMLFDFKKRNINKSNWAKYHWTPRIGFNSEPVGILSWYRCFKDGQKPTNDGGFKSFQLGKGIQQHEIPGCSGEGVNQIEIKLERDSSVANRFTRFQNFSVTIGK